MVNQESCTHVVHEVEQNCDLTIQTHTCPHQIPRVIFEAECQNHYCTDPNSNLQTELNSVPIYHYMLVLQQDKQDRCVTVSYQKVAVGCTCVWAQSS
uniref:Uncharacterized protein n=1 Tax=Astyanax mexicanus TaxID=7994 RepID=A0A8B9GSV6_ASTMX